MDDKKRKGIDPADDFDSPPPYVPEADDDYEDNVSDKASVKTRVNPSKNRGERPRKAAAARGQPPAGSHPVDDPFSLSRPPLSVHDREEWADEFERRERDDDKPSAAAGEVQESRDTPHERKPLPGWAVACGVGGAVLLLVILIQALLPNNSTYTMTVLGAPPGSTLYINGTPGGVPDAQGRITAQGLRKGESYRVRVAHPEYQEVSLDVQSEDGANQRVEVTLQKLSNRAPQPTPRPTQATPPERVSSSEIDYGGPMVLVPAGEFTFGDDSHLPDEQPAHRLNVPAFYIDKHEVTNQQYRKFCDETKRAYPPGPWWEPNYMTSNPNGPVVGISWDDASDYAAWAGKRLPTEAEWEKAASWDPAAGQKRLWPWGNKPSQGLANLGKTKRAPKLEAVGRYGGGASAYGAMDMAGNAAEWVEDFYQPYEGNSKPNAGFGTKYRVVRGGTCASSFDEARTTRRLYHTPEYTQQERAKGTLLVGFRCAVSADNPGLEKHLR